MKLTKECPQCGKSFPYSSPSQDGRTYCSRACQMAAKRITTTCPTCGKEFWYHSCWPRIYCSRQCSAKANVTRQLGVVLVAPSTCEQCGKEITKDNRSGRRFCSSSCFGEWLSKNRNGENHPTYKRIDRVCKQCGQAFKVKPNVLARNEGVFCNIKCKAEWQKLHPQQHKLPVLRGAANPRWKGGVFPYYGPNWRPQRRNARRRDNYTCQRCGKTESELGRQLDVHHIKPFREFGVENHQAANTLSNLVCLCYRCHTWVENHGLDD